jgi:CheY-like chemotaxis protein
LRLLVVDDAPVLRSLFARIATALGHTIVASENSAPAALARARELVPDALVVDGRLRATDIVAFIRHARTDVPAVRVVIVASLEESALVAAAVAAGATGVVRRPLVRAQIGDALRSSQSEFAGERL